MSYSTTSFFDGRGKNATEIQLSRSTSERQNLGKLKFLKLYDMETDPNEVKDVSEENPEIVNQGRFSYRCLQLESSSFSLAEAR